MNYILCQCLRKCEIFTDLAQFHTLSSDGLYARWCLPLLMPSTEINSPTEGTEMNAGYPLSCQALLSSKFQKNNINMLTRIQVLSQQQSLNRVRRKGEDDLLGRLCNPSAVNQPFFFLHCVFNL